MRSLLIDGVWAGSGAALVTLAWLAPLALALGPAATPLSLFAGGVNQAALWQSLAPPTPAIRDLALAAMWLPLGLAALLRTSTVSTSLRTAGAAAIGSVMVLIGPPLTTSDTPLVSGLAGFAWATRLVLAYASLYLYLPAACAWAAVAAIALRTARGRSVPPLVPWFALGGTLAALALYPRFDVPHAAFAGAPLLVVGAWALKQAHTGLAGSAGRAGRMAVFATLLLVPSASVLPHIYGRYIGTAYSDQRTGEAAVYVPLGLERAPVLVPHQTAASIRGAVEFLQEHTSPGEAVFAYPVDPLINFLADRPNPTRFNHLMPGSLSPEDLSAVVTALETARPAYVLWDHGAAAAWHTDPANRPLSDYIWRCYHQEATFDLLLILRRNDC